MNNDIYKKIDKNYKEDSKHIIKVFNSNIKRRNDFNYDIKMFEDLDIIEDNYDICEFRHMQINLKNGYTYSYVQSNWIINDYYNYIWDIPFSIIDFVD